MEEYLVYTEQDENYYLRRIIEIIPILFLIFGVYLYSDYYKIFSSISIHKINLTNIEDHSIPSILPLEPGTYTVGSDYGKRRDPFSRRWKFHKGVDFSAKRGTPIYATANGVVSFSNWKKGYGNMIEIDHQNGYKTMFSHLNRRLVNNGQRVNIGDMIGRVGRTGKATGNHLHYEVFYKNRNLNPNKYF